MINLVCAETARSNCYPKRRKGWETATTQRESIQYVTRIGRLAYFFTFPETHAPRHKAKVVLVAQELRYLLINAAKGLIKHEHKLELI
jgi:hypothetical protein